MVKNLIFAINLSVNVGLRPWENRGCPYRQLPEWQRQVRAKGRRVPLWWEQPALCLGYLGACNPRGGFLGIPEPWPFHLKAPLMAGRIASQPIMVAHWLVLRTRSTATPCPTRLKAGGVTCMDSVNNLCWSKKSGDIRWHLGSTRWRFIGGGTTCITSQCLTNELCIVVPFWSLLEVFTMPSSNVSGGLKEVENYAWFRQAGFELLGSQCS